ncbi:restriction endonuclease subunit S [Methylovulum psychrotolerans]|uniref:Restriction endonuclease subunit S n=1 Tax=Methylovulum psychrotolerans TaxID=1704499 RepID=A0A2S5CGV4_9GAMM|nr:restriction endonuclease subunit S [Methylovulum psychrotolerans]POZ50029.1 restriction endonuclease subunit S [Methylovulum psychrotolerans]
MRLPEGWKLVPIKEICSCIVDCVNKTAAVVDYETPYKMIRTTNVRHGRVDTKNVRYVTKETYKIWTRRGNLENGDLIFTREAPVGEIGILEDASGVFLGQRTVMYRAHPLKSNNLFILYSLQSLYCQKQIEDFSNGGTVAHVRVPDCSEIILKMPPLPEQQKIAQILSTWDKAIEKLEALIAAKQKRKKALMQQLLTGKKRFAGFDEKLNLKHLGEIGKIDAKNLSNATDPNYKFKYISLSDVQAGKINNQLKTFTFKDAPSRARRVVYPCDIIIATVRPNLQGFAKIADNGGYPYIASTGFSTITAEAGYSYDYIFHYIFSNHITFQINSLVVGSNYPAINSSDVKGLFILCPTLPEQQKIAATLSTADQEIQVHQNQLTALKQQKKALMQQLLTGKKRVMIAEAA